MAPRFDSETAISRFRPNHRGYSQPGWQTTALAAAIPNALAIEPNVLSDSKTSVCHSFATPSVKGKRRWTVLPPLRPAFALATIRSQPPNGLPSQVRQQRPNLTPIGRYVHMNVMRLSRLQSALAHLGDAMREVDGAVQEMRAEHDPLAVHIFVSRRQYRQCPTRRAANDLA